MIMNVLVFVIMLWSCDILLSQETWVKVFGGSQDESANKVLNTNDGGLVLIGTTSSNDGDFRGMNKGGIDIFVIKLDSHGDVQWKKTYGGSELDGGTSITTTPDGGYVLTGYTYSNDGDFKGMNKGDADVLVIKLDSNGDIQWKKVFGGSQSDEAVSAAVTQEGEIILMGGTSSNDGDFSGMNKGSEDIFVFRMDSSGTLLWKKLIGGLDFDVSSSSIVTADGGMVLTGFTYSNDGDFTGTHDYNIYALKLDKRGSVKWKKILGDANNGCSSVSNTADSGVVIAGFANWYAPERDLLIFKIDFRGQILWRKVFGGKSEEHGMSVTSTRNGDIVLTGYAESDDGDFYDKNMGGKDIFLLSLSQNGDKVWAKTFGGRGKDIATSLSVLDDGGFVITGGTTSDVGDQYNDGDFYGLGKGGESDIFVIKLDKNGNLQPAEK
jgi:hypothetical protein